MVLLILNRIFFPCEGVYGETDPLLESGWEKGVSINNAEDVKKMVDEEAKQIHYVSD